MTIKPIKKYLTVIRDTPEEKTAGGILLSAAVPERTYTGVIQEVGKEITDFVPGQRVLFAKYAGLEVNDVVVLKEEDIIAEIK